MHRNPDPTADYRGGVLGWRAIVDALNPWDQVKSVARRFRWMMVGRQHRVEDISYSTRHLAPSAELDEIQDDKHSASLSYDGYLSHTGYESPFAEEEQQYGYQSLGR